MTFEQALPQELEWRLQSACQRQFELAAGSEPIATLRFQSRLGSLALGECGGNEWTFKRTGFFAPKITVRAAGSDVDLAVFAFDMMGGGRGSVSFGGGRRFLLRQTNFWATQWVFESEDRTAAVSLSAHMNPFKTSGTLQVAPTAAAWPETPVLLLLIWYVRTLTSEDGATAALVAGSA
jgi:hypothetical protein